MNRFDSIRDKDRCRRLVLEQIRQLSPATYADAEDLVHFVSAGSIDLEARKLDAPEFARLEERLRAFVLENRTKSKLTPAKTYMVNLLSDIMHLSESNRNAAADEHASAELELQADLPAYQRLLDVRERVLAQVEKTIDAAALGIQQHTVGKLSAAVEDIHTSLTGIEYPGIFLIWQYAQDLVDSMSQKLLQDVRAQETYTKTETAKQLQRVHSMGEEHLGAYDCVAKLDKMCLKNRDRRVTVDVEMTDLFDLVLDEKLSGCVLSLGAAAALGGRMIGLKDAMSNFLSLSQLVGANNMRRLILPAVSLASLGALFYVVSDMRYAVERKLVKKFKTAVRESEYVEAQGRRLSRESRKVLRVEAWEISALLQKAIEGKERRREEMETMMLTSEESMRYFESVLDRASALLDKVACVHTDGAIGLNKAVRAD